jgi:endonuclease YncB( thermonuclease family)
MTVTGCHPESVTPPTGPPSSASTHRVTRVYDGDTLEVDGYNDVRLLGINATEEGECFHDEASDFLRAETFGEEVVLEEYGQDQFGRTLAYVWRAGASVNLRLVTGGFAIASTPGDDENLGGQLLAAEEVAYRAGVGLWSDTVCGSIDAMPDVSLSLPVFNPPGPDGDDMEGESVTISSPTATALGGWLLRDESSSNRCLMGDSVSVGPDHPLVVTSADRCWSPGTSPVWNNDGDMAMLLDRNGRVVARVRYSD